MSLPRAQLISVTSDPPGATILVDKKDQGHVTPLKLKLKKGSYIIEAQHSRLRLQSITTNIVVPGAIAILHFKFAYGSVAIRSDPPGATIRSQTGVVGKTPADPAASSFPSCRLEQKLNMNWRCGSSQKDCQRGGHQRTMVDSN
jgi:hypothetical protein